MTALSSSGSSCDDNFHFGPRLTLSSSVSRWERRQVAKKLHIHYQDNYSTNYSDVYGKIEMPQLDEEQRQYFEKVKCHLSPINTNIRDIKYFPDTFMNVIEQISEQLVNKDSEELIKRILSEFLKSLIGLTMKIKDRKACEGGYTRLFDRFANMCCLHTQISFSKEDNAVWPELTGIKHVTSTPDIRLFKHGVSTSKESIHGPMLVSVVKVKKDLRKDSNDFELESGTLESGNLSSSCNSLADSESEEKIPIMELDLDRNILGQHAGDLLLDMYHFHRDVEIPVMKLPGIIVNETEVFLTLLEISKSHFKKLEKNQDLDEEEKATIYYSKPLDILVEQERNILMEILIRLNNVEYNT